MHDCIRYLEANPSIVIFYILIFSLLVLASYFFPLIYLRMVWPLDCGWAIRFEKEIWNHSPGSSFFQTQQGRYSAAHQDVPSKVRGWKYGHWATQRKI